MGDKKILYHSPQEHNLKYSCGNPIKLGDLVYVKESIMNRYQSTFNNPFLLIDIFYFDDMSFDDYHAYCAYIYYNGNTILANLDEIYKIK